MKFRVKRNLSSQVSITVDNVNLFVTYIKIVVRSFRSSLKNPKFVFFICLTSTTGADEGFFLGGGAPLRNGATDW